MIREVPEQNRYSFANPNPINFINKAKILGVNIAKDGMGEIISVSLIEETDEGDSRTGEG